MSQQVEATRICRGGTPRDARRVCPTARGADRPSRCNHQANDRYQAALQAALEERLAEFANHQHQTLTTINAKLAACRRWCRPSCLPSSRR
jgi:hypothetical protein